MFAIIFNIFIIIKNEGTKIELEKLFPKVQKGGAVIVDNYFNFKGVKKATDEYFASKEKEGKAHSQKAEV